MNIFNFTKDIFTDSVIERIAQFSNEKPARIKLAIDIASASIVGGLIKRITSETGMNLLHTIIQKNTTQISDLTDLKDNNAFSEIVTVGDKTLNVLLPSFKSSVSGLVGKSTGLRNSVASSVVSYTMLAIATILKKKVSEKNLDASSLAAYLGGQRENLLNVVPDYNHSIIDTGGLQHVLSNFIVPQKVEEENPNSQSAPAKHFVYDAPEVERPNMMAYLKWVGIGIGVLGALALAYYLWTQRSSFSSSSDTDSTGVALNEAKTIQEPAEKIPVADGKPVADSTKPVSSNVFEAYLADSIKPKGKTLKLDNVDFEDNSPQIKAESKAVIENLTGLMKKYATSEIKFIDYSNDAKPPLTNRMLSVKRAFALKQMLIDGGISFVRVDAEGRSNGVNPKDTTGRKQIPLREIYVKFVKK